MSPTAKSVVSGGVDAGLSSHSDIATTKVSGVDAGCSFNVASATNRIFGFIEIGLSLVLR